jgi:hypothetical protein
VRDIERRSNRDLVSNDAKVVAVMERVVPVGY